MNPWLIRMLRRLSNEARSLREQGAEVEYRVVVGAMKNVAEQARARR